MTYKMVNDQKIKIQGLEISTEGDVSMKHQKLAAESVDTAFWLKGFNGNKPKLCLCRELTSNGYAIPAVYVRDSVTIYFGLDNMLGNGGERDFNVRLTAYSVHEAMHHIQHENKAPGIEEISVDTAKPIDRDMLHRLHQHPLEVEANNLAKSVVSLMYGATLNYRSEK